MGQRPKVNTASIFYDQKCTSLKFRKKKKKKEVFLHKLTTVSRTQLPAWTLEPGVDSGFPRTGKESCELKLSSL